MKMLDEAGKKIWEPVKKKVDTEMDDIGKTSYSSKSKSPLCAPFLPIFDGVDISSEILNTPESPHFKEELRVAPSTSELAGIHV